jgi:hypothetical protein
MKFLKRIFVVLTTLNLMIGTFAWAQKNPKAEEQTFTISGSTGLPDVVMQGLPGNPITDMKGFYAATVQYGWSGTVTPEKEGFTFDPSNRLYSKVIDNQTDQNYVARIITFTISGSVGQEGVIMAGLPNNPVSYSDGTYEAKVPYGWVGRVTPQKEGFIFTPPAKTYNPIRIDQRNQNYAVKPFMLTISGRLVIKGSPIEGVLMSTSEGGISDTTDAQGRYSVKVPYGWSGEITPIKEGDEFDPPNYPYANVITDIIDSQSVPPMESRRPVSRRPTSITPIRTTLRQIDRRKVLVIPVTDVNAADVDEITQDLQVMAHILDGKFTERRQIAGVFTDFGDFFGRDNRETEAIYLQDYGALFLMEVNFAFSSQQQPQLKETKQPQEQVDSTWQQAQRELFSPARPTGPRDIDSPEGYDAQMVEELKSELIRTLKHAANIRNLKTDEWVILNVTGTGQSRFIGIAGYGSFGGGMGGYGGSGGYSYSGGYAGGGGSFGGSGGGGFSYGMGGMGGSPMEFTQSTVLTIRAKKSNIDAFAKGDIDFEQFQEKIKILMY